MPSASANEKSPTLNCPCPAAGERQCAPQHEVRAVSQDQLDNEREQHIADCAWLMERAMARWEAHGDFDARGEADRWRLLRDEAVKARSPEQVARMEVERGLA